MDSGNSGSMQSSSGGEDEFDSRGESISSFLNPTGTGGAASHFGRLSGQQPPFMVQQGNFFDPRTNQLDAFIQQQSSSENPNVNTQYNNDLVWTRGLRSDQSNYAHFGNLTGSSSSSRTHNNTNLLNSQEQNSVGPGSGPVPFSTGPSVQLTAQGSTEQQPIKNPKKRPRASRRAPTTVLTTDTTNFRQMVQEFTGIPAAPFSGPPYSRRLDLLSTVRSGHLDGLGSLYPLRPAAQKVQTSPFLPSSSSPMFNSAMIDATVPSTNISTSNVGNSNNFQLPPDLSLLAKQPQNLSNLQSQIAQLQPLLQSSPSLKNQLGQVFGNLGMSHDHQQVEGNFSGFSNLGGSSGAGGRERTEANMRENIGTFGGNISSEFHADKGLENVSSAADGTVSSWICQSD